MAKRKSSDARQSFSGRVKVTLTIAAVCPTPPQQSLSSVAQSSCRFHVSDLCCCCFLLWAEFYTACQSPERHTLEGPVEWDTKSDPSGEWLFSHLPTPFCLALFVCQPCLLAFLVIELFYFTSGCDSFFLSSSLCFPLDSIYISPDSWLSLSVSDPLCFEEATQHLLTHSVMEWSAKPGQANIHPSMHRSKHATNEYD